MDVACSTPLQDGRFLLLESLGRGGMGSVYRAFDRAEQRLVALKVPSKPDDPGPAHPLSEEFDNWSRLRHPNIVRAYELGHAERGPIAPGTPYLVLEHVHGKPAHRELGPGRVDDEAIETVAAQVLSALAHVHARGYVHRDLKPGNVLTRRVPGRRTRYMLTDFGLATRSGSTRPLGTFSGSLPYVAPESLLGLPLDGRADLYGLGVLLYRLATGELPVPRGGARETLSWHLDETTADPSRVRAGLSPRLSLLISRLTQRDPTRRPESASSALDMLGRRAATVENLARVHATSRGSLAGLRLAFDAVRLGARRLFRLPVSTSAAELLLHELSVWSQVRGLRFYRLTDDPERLVLRLLTDRGAEGAALLQRFELDRWLALDLLGGLPLYDPARVASRSHPATRPAARAIGDLILDCAAQRPLVLCSGGRPGPPLVEAIKLRLTRDVNSGTTPSPGRGGLLLVIDDARRVTSPRDKCRVTRA
jgi:hypothetical protein